MNLSINDIRRKQFDKVFRGYDPTEVDLFLKQVADRLESVQDDARRADERVREMESKLLHYEKVELALQEALESARETARRSEATAEEKARLMIQEAELRAEKILHDAERERHGLRQDLVRLNSRQTEVAARLRGFLLSELEVLAQFQGDDPVGFIKLQSAQTQGMLPASPARLEAPSEEPEAALRADDRQDAADRADARAQADADARAQADADARAQADADARAQADADARAQADADARAQEDADHRAQADDRAAEANLPVAPAQEAAPVPEPAAWAPPDVAPTEWAEPAPPDAPEAADWAPEPESPIGPFEAAAAPPQPPEPTGREPWHNSADGLPGAYSAADDRPAADPPAGTDVTPPRAVTGGWDLRSLVTGSEAGDSNVAGSEEERERIRRILDDLE